MSGWSLVLRGVPNAERGSVVKLSAVTNADGDFTFAAVSPGDYTLQLRRRDSAHTVTSSDTIKLTIDRGDFRSWNFKIAKVWSVEGKVFGDANLNKVNDPNESLAHVLVFGDRDADRKLDVDEPYTQSDKNGKYKLDGLMGNQADVVFMPPEGWRRKQIFSADASAAEQPINVAFTNTAEIAGQVFFDVDGNGKYQDGENALFAWDPDVNWRVWVDYDNDGVFDANEPTARSTNPKFIYGDFWIDNVRPGTYWVQFQTRANKHVTTQSRYPVELNDGQSSAQLQFGYK